MDFPYIHSLTNIARVNITRNQWLQEKTFKSCFGLKKQSNYSQVVTNNMDGTNKPMPIDVKTGKAEIRKTRPKPCPDCQGSTRVYKDGTDEIVNCPTCN